MVIQIWGGFRAVSCRSAAGVSPVRTATRISGTMIPFCQARSVISCSGTERFLCTSFDSALSGDTYTTCATSASSPWIAARIEPIDAYKKGGQSLARSRGSRDQGVPAAGNGRPAQGLGLGGSRKFLLKPFGHDGMKVGLQHVFSYPESSSGVR